MKEILKDLIESLFNETEDEIVIYDSGCGEVLEMIESCGLSKKEAEELAKEYEAEVEKINRCLNWETTTINNCKAIKIEKSLLQDYFKPEKEIFNTIDGDNGEGAWLCGEWVIYDPCCEEMRIIHKDNFNI